MGQQQGHEKQLWMLRYSAPAPAVPMPQGWRVRPMRPGEGAAWSGIVRAAGFFTESPLQPVALWERVMGGDAMIRHENVFFACDTCGRPVAVAALKLMTDEQMASYPPVENGLGYLHFVAALPECRGAGAGSAVSAAVIERCNDLGFGGCVLATDDFRLPAIRSYLRLGWLPLLYAPGMASRWQAVLASLGLAAAHPALDENGKETALALP